MNKKTLPKFGNGDGNWSKMKDLLYLNRKKILFMKRVREPNLCESNFCQPSSHIFSVNFDLWFTFFHSSQIIPAPIFLWIKLKKYVQLGIIKLISEMYLCHYY
jgi:hypothetical protein